ncbi:UDP-glucose/GDP-mannose dehydrogenase family protein [bacterium]|nr:UDP-glucose/GDP-mannose dehydrogenase family protein [bacterium]
MNIAVIGTGYVGLVTGTCLAEMGNEVVCLDIDENKVSQLKAGEVPIYEPGLKDLIEANTSEGRLSFSTEIEAAISRARCVMIAVGTPSNEDGSADLSAVHSACDTVARCAARGLVLIIKSTVPVGTGAEIAERMLRSSRPDIAVVSNPEFLKQGDAVNDFLKPERIVVGAEDEFAIQLIQELYSPFLRTGNRIIIMDRASSEMTKYVANAFLATKISFMNEVSRLCQLSGADVEQVRNGICCDSRIGEKFLFPGLGFGGSCFPKDVKALIQVAAGLNTEVDILKAVDRVNYRQRETFFERVSDFFNGQIMGRKIAVWGLAFKPRTDDIREAPALYLLDRLLEAGAELSVFDPRATSRVKAIYADRLNYSQLAYDALEGAEALVIATEWNEFRRPDFDRMRRLMARPVIFDGRNLYPPKRMIERGFSYFCVGRPDATLGLPNQEHLS